MIFIRILILAHLFYSIWVIIKIYKSILLNKNQKILNVILTILIPFLWGFIVSNVIKPSKNGFVDNHEEIEKERNVKYYENRHWLWP